MGFLDAEDWFAGTILSAHWLMGASKVHVKSPAENEPMAESTQLMERLTKASSTVAIIPTVARMEDCIP